MTLLISLLFLPANPLSCLVLELSSSRVNRRHDLARRLLPSLFPVLIILDRNVDLVPMISHSWTYQALVNDVLGMRLNRVGVEVSSAFSLHVGGADHLALFAQAPEGGRMAKKMYDLDSKDFFWAKNAASPFPQVAEEIDLQLNK